MRTIVLLYISSASATFSFVNNSPELPGSKSQQTTAAIETPIFDWLLYLIFVVHMNAQSILLQLSARKIFLLGLVFDCCLYTSLNFILPLSTHRCIQYSGGENFGRCYNKTTNQITKSPLAETISNIFRREKKTSRNNKMAASTDLPSPPSTI